MQRSISCKTIAIIVSLCVVQHSNAQRRPSGQDASLVKGILASVDTEKNSLTVTIHKFDRASATTTDTNKTFTLTKETTILQDDTTTKLADLKKGNPVTIKVDGTNAVSITLIGGTTQAEYRSYNADRNTITILGGRNMTKQVCHLIKTTKITGSDGKAIELKDLKPGIKISITKSVEDDNTVIRIQAMP